MQTNAEQGFEAFFRLQVQSSGVLDMVCCEAQSDRLDMFRHEQLFSTIS